MPKTALRFGFTLGTVAGLALFAAAWVTHVRRIREVDTVSDEQKLAHSLGIIRTSSAEHPKVLKVLFYGQSIIRSGWDKQVLDHWHHQYPDTVFVEQNRALGGFSSISLVRTAAQDVAAFYPDLIVFHDYGDHHAYEQIMRIFRSNTAADVIVQTDHGDTMPEPYCPEGLQETLHRPPGCAGYLWLHQREWNDEMSFHKIPPIAKKYGLAIEPQRTWWREYLLRTHVAPGALLMDGLHPNAQGLTLMADLFDRYFDNLVAHWNGETGHRIVSLPLTAAIQSGEDTSIVFQGTRLELLTSAPVPSWPSITMDGTPTAILDGCFQVSRASTVQIVPEWPGVRRIKLGNDHTAEDWTATLTNISADQSHFDFAIRGSITGDDGSGTSTADFVSRSGKIRIAAQDWMPASAFDVKHIALPSTFVIRWSVGNLCDGEPEIIDMGNGTKQYRYVLATTTSNAEHTLRARLPAGFLSSAQEFREYKPDL
jgi:hypothetical protein